jgi:hypothetical protein
LEEGVVVVVVEEDLRMLLIGEDDEVGVSRTTFPIPMI